MWVAGWLAGWLAKGYSCDSDCWMELRRRRNDAAVQTDELLCTRLTPNQADCVSAEVRRRWGRGGGYKRPVLNVTERLR